MRQSGGVGEDEGGGGGRDPPAGSFWGLNYTDCVGTCLRLAAADVKRLRKSQQPRWWGPRGTAVSDGWRAHAQHIAYADGLRNGCRFPPPRPFFFLVTKASTIRAHFGSAGPPASLGSDSGTQIGNSYRGVCARGEGGMGGTGGTGCGVRQPGNWSGWQTAQSVRGSPVSTQREGGRSGTKEN